MSRAGAGILAAAAVLLAAPALATGGPPEKAPPSGTVSGVTVTGEKPDPLVDKTTQFVRQHLPENVFTDQYPRFRDAVCVRVLGLPPEFGAFIKARVIAVADQVRAPVARAGDCTPNVNIVFSPTPQAQIDDIYRRRDILLGFRFHSQVKRVTTFDRPIQAWYLTRTRDDHGESFLEVENALVSWAEKPAGRAGSRLSHGVSAEVVHSLVIADANKVSDAKIGGVADYIAVLALARWTRLERCNTQVSTVLNLLADGCDADNRPEAATPADLALLTGLYSVDPREDGAAQRASIASAMRKASDAAATLER
ncbi:hypothetical protein [Phenylobacterium sp.]|uniref:hypothetical protein n=1 Tax=Phenylobacterium sp. TaxID=1871053 RepID=UPI002BBE0B95|nr:hypothetical protein [Phenylobacterium sp.]HLZ75239.1 hypothetical protein [Phenylobacterium sp.]